MEFTKEEQININTLSPIMRTFFNWIVSVLNRIINLECDEERISPHLRHIINVDKGFIDESEYITADKAYSKEYLNCSRYHFFNKIKPKYGLKAYFTHRNKPLGFKRSEIIDIVNKEKHTT